MFRNVSTASKSIHWRVAIPIMQAYLKSQAPRKTLWSQYIRGRTRVLVGFSNGKEYVAASEAGTSMFNGRTGQYRELIERRTTMRLVAEKSSFQWKGRPVYCGWRNIVLVCTNAGTNSARAGCPGGVSEQEQRRAARIKPAVHSLLCAVMIMFGCRHLRDLSVQIQRPVFAGQFCIGLLLPADRWK